MLLAHVDDIVQSDRDIQYSYQLYEEMIDAWLKREQGFIQKTDDLRQFSERLAVDLYRNRASRGSERIARSQLAILAKDWGIQLEDWKLSARSLLNRDADGNYKFAHRSIMEYLFVQRLLDGAIECLDEDLTDQMVDFYMEIMDHLIEEDPNRALRLLTEIIGEGAYIANSRGRKFFHLIQKESRSKNPLRQDLAKTLLGLFCFEILNPAHSNDINIAIRLFEFGSSTSFSGGVSSIASISVSSFGRKIPRVVLKRIADDKQPLSGKFVEFPNFSNEGGFLQTFIELNGEVVGALVCYFSTSQARKRVIKDTRWLTLETLLNPHEPC